VQDSFHHLLANHGNSYNKVLYKFVTGSLYKNFRAYWCYHGYVIADFGAIAAVLKITTQN